MFFKCPETFFHLFCPLFLLSSPSLQDVNSVAVSPNDKLLASASQDRTAKLWSLAGEGNLGLLGVFRGHRRGVWTVCFSPVDQVLATSSADGTTKLWSLQDFSCLKVGANVVRYHRPACCQYWIIE